MGKEIKRKDTIAMTVIRHRQRIFYIDFADTYQTIIL